jgi:hypothetical protein
MAGLPLKVTSSAPFRYALNWPLPVPPTVIAT